MSGARDLAAASRQVLRFLRAGEKPSEDAANSLLTLEAALERWDAAGNPAHPAHADQRLHYLATLGAFLDASGGMAVGAFANDELAGRAVALRSALAGHLEEVAAVWDVARERVD